MTSALAELLAETPSFPGAACRGRSDLFDEHAKDEPVHEAAQRFRQAVAICRTCPERYGCRAWFKSLPESMRPPGVVAGIAPNLPVVKEPKTMDAEPIRAHIAALKRSGMKLGQLSEVSGVSMKTISSVRSGRDRLHARNARKILAVPLPKVVR